MIDYKNQFRLSGKTVVVSGGAGLLGKEIVTAVAQFGAKTIITDTDKMKGRALARDLSKSGFEAAYYYLDMTDGKNLKANMSRMLKAEGPADVWVNCAYPRTKDWNTKAEGIRYDSWQKNVDMHLNSYALSSIYAAESMKKRGGCIINLGSIYGMVGPDFSIYDNTPMTMPAAYAAIKGGIINTSRYLASYFGKYNIRVNAVCPGGIFDGQYPGFVKKYSAKTCLKRMGKAEEVASAVVFLSSQAAAYITGTVIAIDGGWTAI